MELDIQFQFWFFKSINSSYNSIYDLISTRSDLVFINLNWNWGFSPVKLDSHPTLANPVFKYCRNLVDFYHHICQKHFRKLCFHITFQQVANNMEGCSVFWMLRFAFITYFLSNLAKPFMDDHHLICITKLLKRNNAV